MSSELSNSRRGYAQSGARPAGRFGRRVGLTALLLAAGAAIASGQIGRVPMLTNGVENAARPDYRNESRRVAPGSIFLIRGFDLGPEELVIAQAPLPRRLPDIPGGTTVEFQSTQTEEVVQPLLLHAWTRQVSGIVPADLPPGEYNVSVSFGRRSSEPEAFQVVAEAPGIFTLSMEGDGPGVIQTADSPFAAALNKLTDPALPGDSLAVWTTGLGGGGHAPGEVVVEVGTVIVPADAAEPAPGFHGVELVRFRLPVTGPFERGCYVPLRVGTKTGVSNTVTVSISDVRGSCVHPLGFSVDQMSRLDAGGALKFATLSINRRDTPRSGTGFFELGGKAANASARFYGADAVDVARQSNLAPPGSLGCRIAQVNQFAFSLLGFPVFAEPAAERLNYGADRGHQSVERILRLMGPDRQFVELEAENISGETPEERYYRTPAFTPWEFFRGGRWRFESEPADGIGPFRAEIDLAPAIAFEPPAVLSKFQPAVFSWPTAGLTDVQITTVRMDYFAPGLGQFDRFRPLALSIECRAPAKSGTITVPVDELQWYPGAERGSATLTFEVSEPTPQRFHAPGLDYGTVRTSHTVVRRVEVR